MEEYKVSAADSNVADLSSALTILTQSQPFNNHNGGNLMFGKDGYYILTSEMEAVAAIQSETGKIKILFLEKYYGLM